LTKDVARPLVELGEARARRDQMDRIVMGHGVTPLGCL
jgi:hypothetical protein